MRLITVPAARAADTRSPGRFLLALARGQWRTLALGMLMGILWMLSIALFPWAVGHVVDAMAARSVDELLRWSLTLAGLGAISALAGTARHYCAVLNWLTASFRSAEQVDEAVLAAGPALTRRVPTGQVAAVFTNDVWRIGNAFDVTARFAGAVVSYVVVGVILLRASVSMGLLVLVVGPLLLGSLALIVRPLQRRQAAQREEAGRLTTLGADTVAGLRVLRGIGGEDTFVRRYEAQSGVVRQAGWRVAGMQAALDSSQVLLPGLFVVLVTWSGAREALAGSITAGQLVSFFGYATFLTMPFWTVIEFVDKAIKARIAATKTLEILRVRPDHVDGPGAGDVPSLTGPGAHADLLDPESGIVVHGGRFTAVVSAVPEESAAVLDRLARLGPGESEASLGGIPLRDLPLEQVRRTVVLSDSDAALFTGDLAGQLLPLGSGPLGSEGPEAREAMTAALAVASAADVLDAVPGGLAGRVEERGRTFSGGQRQRLALARAVLTQAPVLALVEPTSAVDAHSEARIADGLARARAGSTTVVSTASPLVLEYADEVAFLEAGVVTAVGTHADLLRRSAAYREVVHRGGEGP